MEKKYLCKPFTVAARSKAWNVFALSKAGIAGSDPTQGIDVCLCLFCVCIGSGPETGWSPVRGVLPNVLGLRNWSETKRFTYGLCSNGRAVTQRLDAGFPPRRPGFAYGQHVGFVVDKATLGQVFSEYFRFPCQSFHRFLHYHNHLGLTQ
jgi:hypothetical protein